MLILWIVSALAVIIITVVAFVTHHFFNFTCKRKTVRRTDEEILDIRKKEYPEHKDMFIRGFEWIAAQKPETHSIISRDGLRLNAEYFENPEHRGIVLMFHGYRSSPHGDFAAVMEFVYSLGFSLFLPSQRAHQDSEGKYICFGAKERFDCVDWAEYLRHTFGTDVPVILHGISMGCTTVVASTGLDLPDNVKGVIADCGFTSPGEIIAHCMRQWFKFAKFPIYYTVTLTARLRAKFSFGEFSTLDAVKKSKIPIFFIHGNADNFVPPYMTKRNYAECASEKRLLLVDNAEHAVSYLIAPEICENALREFTDKCVPRVSPC